MCKSVCLTIVITISLVVTAAQGQVPGLLSYQGRLLDAVGDPVSDGPYPVEFKLWRDATSTAPADELWASGVVNVITVDGLFSVILGQSPMPSIDPFLFVADTNVWLGTTVGADPEMSPRSRMTGVGYSMFSQYTYQSHLSDSATGAEEASSAWFSDSTEAITDGGVDFADIGQNGATSGQILKWDGSEWKATADDVSGGGTGGGWTDAGSIVHLDATSDSVGIGTSTPSEKLEVVGNIYVVGKATIGQAHTNTGDYAFVAGENNTTSGKGSSIAGGQTNIASANLSSVGGGTSNNAGGSVARIGGGENNSAGGEYSSVVGGTGNSAAGDSSFVGGGTNNGASGLNATVSGGNIDTASGDYATVGGGRVNTASGYIAIVSGGNVNTASGNYSTVSGGQYNEASFANTTVGGGFGDTASGHYATVSGGNFNVASGLHSTVGGGGGNHASGDSSFIGGGSDNLASGHHATVSGGKVDTASGHRATIGGGWGNVASGEESTISGGGMHEAKAPWSTIGGGFGNDADSAWATIGGGSQNDAIANHTAIGGGYFNIASGIASAIAGGENNSSSGDMSSIGGGSINTASGLSATVPGGNFNTASGDYSFAAGRKANAVHDGSFVWGDSSNTHVSSTKPNQFTIRAENGVNLVSDADPANSVEVGERFRDNGIVAWARVRWDAVPYAEFGVTSVVRNFNGSYTVTIDAAATSALSLIPIAQAELPSGSAIRITMIDILTANSFNVYIYNQFFTGTDNDFVFMVTAR